MLGWEVSGEWGQRCASPARCVSPVSATASKYGPILRLERRLGQQSGFPGGLKYSASWLFWWMVGPRVFFPAFGGRPLASCRLPRVNETV